MEDKCRVNRLNVGINLKASICKSKDYVPSKALSIRIIKWYSHNCRDEMLLIARCMWYWRDSKTQHQASNYGNLIAEIAYQSLLSSK